MTQQEINEAERKNPDNWTGPKWMSIYFSKKDSRCFAPKQIKTPGPTMNLGSPAGYICFLIGIAVMVIIVFAGGCYTS